MLFDFGFSCWRRNFQWLFDTFSINLKKNHVTLKNLFMNFSPEKA